MFLYLLLIVFLDFQKHYDSLIFIDGFLEESGQPI
jgi:hypothetical protein